MPNCNRCGNAIKWPEPYHEGNKPLNLDDSPHTCKTETKKDVEKVGASEIMSECSAFLNAFSEVPDAKFDALARIYISRMMKR